MSAYIVNDDHINVLVSYFVEYRSMYQLWCKIGGEFTYLTADNAKLLAYQLHKENIRSVNSRYSETSSDEMYEFEYIEQAKQSYTTAEIAKAIDGLEYQSCEHDDWDGSDAKLNLNQMRKHLLSSLEGYEEANTWSIDSVKRHGMRVV